MMSKFICLKPSRCGALVVATLVLALAACSQQDQGTASSSKAAAPSMAASPAGSAASVTFASYTSALPSTDGNTQCSLDMVNDHSANGNVTVSAGSTVVFGGWAGDGKGNAANKFLLVLKGDQMYAAPVDTNIARPDVAKALGSDGMANSGFNVSALLAGVAAGSYTVFFADPANPSNVCATRRAIVVQ